MADEMSEDDQRAPYVTYSNLTDFIEQTLVQAALPERIDRSYLSDLGMSPHMQLLLLQALRVIGLIDDDRHPTDALRYAVQDRESRREVVKAWAKDFYAGQIELAKRDSAAIDMQASFGKFGYQGSTLRKAMSFYVALSEDVDLPTSRYFAAARQFPQPSSRRPEGPRRGRGRPIPPTPFAPSVGFSAPTGERRSIAFGNAGQVVIDVQLRWLDLPIETMSRLRELIGELEALGRGDLGAAAN